MPPKKDKDKGKGKGKGKGKKAEDDPNKLTAVDRQFCELEIADLQKKIARLRAHLATLEDSNIAITEKLRELDEDRIDTAGHLDRELDEKKNMIIELEERLLEVTKVREMENTDAENKIKDLEAKYKAMHDQLSSEIKLLNGKLKSLEEFRMQRDNLMAKFDDQEEERREAERLHKEALYNLEQKTLMEKDQLKKDVELKLLEVSEDFTRTSEIRNSGYTRRLIRENIALQKEIHALTLSQEKLQKEFDEEINQHKNMADKFDKVKQDRKQLLWDAQQKVEAIEMMTKRYEELYEATVAAEKFQKEHESKMQQDYCDRFTYKTVALKLRLLGQRLEIARAERNQMKAAVKDSMMEIQRLRGFIRKVETAIQMSIGLFHGGPGLDDKEISSQDSETIREASRQDLLWTLIDIMQAFDEEEDIRSSVRTISEVSSSATLPDIKRPAKSSSLIDIFKREAKKVGSAEIISPEYQLKVEGSKIIPKPMPIDENTLVDAEVGSVMIFSSSKEDDLQLVQVDDEQGEGEDGASSDYQSSVTPPPRPSAGAVSNDGTSFRYSRSAADSEFDDDINLFY